MQPLVQNLRLQNEQNQNQKPKFKCSIGICRKEFSSKKTLGFHERISHSFNPKGLKITLYKCPFVDEECGERGIFMYKSTRDRHVVKIHGIKSAKSKRRNSSESDKGSSDNGSSDKGSSDADISSRSLMEWITGFNHPRTRQVLHQDGEKDRKRNIECPASSNCLVRFCRVYDLKRHLQSVHPDFDPSKENL